MPSTTTINMANYFPGGSEIARRLGDVDWSMTAIGDPPNWPERLMTTVQLCLVSPAPMLVAFGPERTTIYNDAYARLIFGTTASGVLARPAPEVWRENWDRVRESFERALDTGQPRVDEAALLVLPRSGVAQETFHTISYSPLVDTDSCARGVFCTVTEETSRVLADRRLQTLHDLATRLAQAISSAEQACHAAACVLARNAHDVPFALIYLLDTDRFLLDADAKSARLAAACGLPVAPPFAPARVDLMALSDPATGWPFAAVVDTHRLEMVTQLRSRFGALPDGAWPQPPHAAAVLPIMKPCQQRLAGFLVAGLNPRYAFDADYRRFLDLLASHIGSAVAAEETGQRLEALAEIARVRRETERRIINVIESVSDSFHVIDADGRFSYLNAAAKRMLTEKGVDAARLIGKHIFEGPFPGAGDANPLSRAITRVMTERVPIEVENYHRPWKSWHAVRIYPMSDGGVSILLQDITERKRAEEALRHSEARLRIALDATKLAIWEWDFATNRIQCSERAYEITGIPREQFAADVETLRKLVHPEDVEIIRRADAAVAQGNLFEAEYRLIRTDGETRWVANHGRVECDAAGRAVRMIGTLADITERKHSEAALHQSEAEFRAFFELAAVGTTQVDVRTKKFLRVNRRFADMVGYTPEELSRISIAELTPSNELPANLELLNRALRGELGEISLEKRLIRKDDQMIWVIVTASVVRDADGRPLRTVAVIQDITERKRAEEQIRQSEERLRRAIEIETVGVTFFKTDGTIIDCNEAFLRQSGYSRADLDNGLVRWDVMTPPEWMAHSVRALEEFSSMGRTIPYEKEYIRKDGSRWCALFAATQLAPDEGVEFVVDITEAKRAEAKVRESEQHFRRMADSSPMMIWVIDTAGRIEFANQTFLDFFGLTRDGVVHFDWPAMVHGDDREAYVQAIATALRERQPLHIRARVQRCDGQWRWIESRGNPRIDAGGVVTGYIGSSPDITEMYESQQALRQADRRKDEFLATLGHELRNPLAAIRYSLSALEMTGEASPAAERIHGVIERKLSHVLRLVDDLLEVSRITTGKIELHREVVELATVLNDAVETTRPLVEAAHHRLSVALPPEPLRLWADPVRAAQIFANLITNAANYTEAGGRIWITAQRDADNVVICVRDTGIGIPPDRLSDVFGLFVQVRRNGDSAVKGLGIGLTLVRNLVQMHGGRVEARSAGRGRGSEFVVHLPLAESLAQHPHHGVRAISHAPHPTAQ